MYSVEIESFLCKLQHNFRMKLVYCMALESQMALFSFVIVLVKRAVITTFYMWNVFALVETYIFLN